MTSNICHILGVDLATETARDLGGYAVSTSPKSETREPKVKNPASGGDAQEGRDSASSWRQLWSGCSKACRTASKLFTV